MTEREGPAAKPDSHPAGEPDSQPAGELDIELGVVIPTLNEARTLPHLLRDLGQLSLPARIVVADGGSGDDTVEVARGLGARVIPAPRGRARQMNVGAASLSTPWILFLHADSRVPAQTRQALRAWLEAPSPEEAAHFAFRLDTRGVWWSLIEWGQRIRERVTGLAYGDQGILLSRRRWQLVGGIPDIPLMEDVEFVRRLRKSGGLRRIDAPVITSARRYENEGPVRAWVRNAALITLFGLGVPTRALARFYPALNGGAKVPSPSGHARGSSGNSGGGSGRSSTESPIESGDERSEEAPMVLVFAKAPEPGRVKTRLAVDLGEDEAARIYRQIGRQVVDQLRGGPFRLRVCHSPPHAEFEVRAWLGDEGLEFTPQASGDLGRRMHRALETALSESPRACVVGTDAPDVDQALVRNALARLADHDVVFGPARDGGYYLVGLRRPAPELFRDIPWSTDQVLEKSLEAAARSGLSVATLPMLSDVDRVEDLPREYLS